MQQTFNLLVLGSNPRGSIDSLTSLVYNRRKGEETMPYYDDRDYFYDADSIDDLYDDNDEDSMTFEDNESPSSSWEYDYHQIADELIDD